MVDGRRVKGRCVKATKANRKNGRCDRAQAVGTARKTGAAGSNTFTFSGIPHAPGRTYLAGTDLAPPERVPLTEADFASEHEAAALLLPTAVTDDSGRLLPQWAPLDESLRPVAPPRKKKTVVVS